MDITRTRVGRPWRAAATLAATSVLAVLALTPAVVAPASATETADTTDDSSTSEAPVCQIPTASLSAATVAAGSSVTVSGCGFTPGAAVNASYQGPTQGPLGTLTANSFGRVSASTTLETAGTYRFILVASDSGANASATLEVTGGKDPEPSPGTPDPSPTTPVEPPTPTPTTPPSTPAPPTGGTSPGTDPATAAGTTPGSTPDQGRDPQAGPTLASGTGGARPSASGQVTRPPATGPGGTVEVPDATRENVSLDFGAVGDDYRDLTAGAPATAGQDGTDQGGGGANDSAAGTDDEQGQASGDSGISVILANAGGIAAALGVLTVGGGAAYLLVRRQRT